MIKNINENIKGAAKAATAFSKKEEKKRRLIS